ncbi:MAG: c-type cytochrome [Planctomycetales bacterium]|nr:c-type cytochrome [Planctomycetales bacterium]
MSRSFTTLRQFWWVSAFFVWFFLEWSCAVRAELPAAPAAVQPAATASGQPEGHRSPVHVVLGPDEKWLVTANETTNSLSLIRLDAKSVVDELACGDRPAGLARCLDGEHLVVSCESSGDLWIVRVDQDRLHRVATIDVGYQPVGLAVHPDGDRAYVGLTATGELVELSLRDAKLVRRVKVGSWPRYLAISPDGSRLAVGCSGSSTIAVLDTTNFEVLYEEKLTGGINIGHMQCSQDGEYVYFPWMVYRSNPINRGNIRNGWVLASRIGRVRLDGPAYREAISLDVGGRAVSDPHGLAMTNSGRRLVVSASGTHELLVYRRDDLPFIGAGGPGDLIDNQLLNDKDMFYRIELGGRPLGMEMSRDNRTLYVANYLRDSVQVVDIEDRDVLAEIDLGHPEEISLVRQGMAVFYDGQRSLDQWYSCHSCHHNGGVNSKSMDTWNDGTPLTMKTVLPLYHVTETSPWTWHGWQQDLDNALHKSFTTTMQGNELGAGEAEAVKAFLQSLELPPNPFRGANGELSAAAQRGKVVFESTTAGCADCHSGPYFTDGQIHDVGLGSAEDHYQGFNTPTLQGLYRKVRFLHDGRAKSLESLLADHHAPEKVTGQGALTDQQRQDLIEYLMAL